MWGSTFSYESTEAAEGQVVECDYENCTPLFKRIETREWEAVADFLQTGSWPYYFFKDGLSPAAQAHTWVVQMDQDSLNQVKQRQLPLHRALELGAPLRIVRKLVKRYPESVSCADHEGMLPLHLALSRAADNNVVIFLLQAFPNAVEAKAKNGRTALQCAMNSRKISRIVVIKTFGVLNGLEDSRIDVRAMSLLNNDKLENWNRQLVILEHEKCTVEAELEKREELLQKVAAQLREKNQELREVYQSVELAASFDVDQYQNTREMREIKEKQRFQLMEAAQHEVEDLDKRIREEQAFLRSYLNGIIVCIARSYEVDGTLHLEQRVNELTERRLLHERERAMAEMEKMKQTLRKQLNSMENEFNEEIEAMQMVLEGLDSTNLHEEPHEDLMELETELVPLQHELKREREEAKSRLEIQILKRLLENEVAAEDEVEAEDHEEAMIAIATMEQSKIEKANLEELESIKENARALKNSIQFKAFLRQATRDLKEIRDSFDELHFQSSESQAKAALEKMAATIGIMSSPNFEAKSVDDVLGLKIEMSAMREKLKKLAAVETLKREITLLLMDIRAEMEHSQGQTKQDLAAVRKLVVDFSRLTNEFNSYDELATVTKELRNMRLASWKSNGEELRQTINKLDNMRYMLAKQHCREVTSSEKTNGSLQESVDLGVNVITDCLSAFMVMEMCF